MGGLSIENNNDLFGIGAEALRGGVSAASSGLKLLQSMDGKEIKALNDAEIVKLIDPNRKKDFIPAELNRERIAENLQTLNPLIKEAASTHQIDESLITAVIINESGGKIEAVSDTGAYGVMQFTRDIYAPNPKKQFFKTSINPFVPEQAIDRGTAFLTYLRDLPYIKGDLEKIAAGYNQGEGAVADAVASAEAKGGNWKDYFWSTTKFNDPARRSEGLKFIASIKSILSLQDTRVSSAVHSLLANGPEIAQNNNVPSAKEWKQQHMDFNAEGSIVEIAPYAQKI